MKFKPNQLNTGLYKIYGGDDWKLNFISFYSDAIQYK